MTEQTFNQEFQELVKAEKEILDEEYKAAKTAIEKKAVIKLWSKYSRQAKTLADLVELATKAPFKDYQDELPMKASSADGSGRRTRHTPTEAELDALKQAFKDAKATKAPGVTKAEVIDNLPPSLKSMIDEKWQTFSKAVGAKNNGERGKGARVWLA
jgi:hypothetical protein